jgi:hypothetical protein
MASRVEEYSRQYLILKKEAINFSEMPVGYCNPEYHTPHNDSCENLRSNTECAICTRKPKSEIEFY